MLGMSLGALPILFPAFTTFKLRLILLSVVSVLRQGLEEPRLASDLLYSRDWPGTQFPPASTS